VKTLKLRRFDDLHVHFRGLKSKTPAYYEDNLMEQVAPFTMNYCGRATIMPNPKPRHILCVKDVKRYKSHIEMVRNSVSPQPSFDPIMTIEISDSTTLKIIEEAHSFGVIAGKIYPTGIYGKGLSDFFSYKSWQKFGKMNDLGMIVLIHGELDLPGVLVTNREKIFLENVFIPFLSRYSRSFPNLRIVLEHVSSVSGVETVKCFGKNVAATITAHHLCTTLNNVVGKGTQPHNMCNPIPKDYHDMYCLQETAMSGNPKFFLGSDSAPHIRKNKECAHGACGAFTAPILPQLLAEIFENAGKLDKLEDFTSRFGAEFYGLPLNEGKIKLVKKDWIIPEQYGDVVPFMAGQKLQWQLLLE